MMEETTSKSKKSKRRIRSTQEFNQLNRKSLEIDHAKNSGKKTTQKNKSLGYLPKIVPDCKENQSPTVHSHVIDNNKINIIEKRQRCSEAKLDDITSPKKIVSKSMNIKHAIRTPSSEEQDSEVEIRKKKRKKKKVQLKSSNTIASEIVAELNVTRKSILKSTTNNCQSHTLFAKSPLKDVCAMNEPGKIRNCSSSSEDKSERRTFELQCTTFDITDLPVVGDCNSTGKSVKFNTPDRGVRMLASVYKGDQLKSYPKSPHIRKSSSTSSNLSFQLKNVPSTKRKSETSKRKDSTFDTSEDKRSIATSDDENQNSTSNRKIKLLASVDKGDRLKSYPKSPHIRKLSSTSSHLSESTSHLKNVPSAKRKSGTSERRDSTFDISEDKRSIVTPHNKTQNCNQNFEPVSSSESKKYCSVTKRRKWDKSLLMDSFGWLNSISPPWNERGIGYLSSSDNTESGSSMSSSNPTKNVKSVEQIILTDDSHSPEKIRNSKISMTNCQLNNRSFTLTNMENDTSSKRTIKNKSGLSLNKVKKPTGMQKRTSLCTIRKKSLSTMTMSNSTLNSSYAKQVPKNADIHFSYTEDMKNLDDSISPIKKSSSSKKTFPSPEKKCNSVSNDVERFDISSIFSTKAIPLIPAIQLPNSGKKSPSVRKMNESRSPRKTQVSLLEVPSRPLDGISSPVRKPKSIKKMVQIEQVSSSNEATTSSAIKKTKMPNFALIHQRAYDKLENLKEMSERKAARAQLLMSGKKPEEGSSSKNADSHLKIPSPRLKIKSPKSRKLLRYSPRKSLDKIKKLQTLTSVTTVTTVLKKIVPSTFNPRVKEEFSKGINKSKIPKVTNNRNNQKASRQEEIKTVANKLNAKKNCSEKRRHDIQSVRTNRRFELLMKMRNGKK